MGRSWTKRGLVLPAPLAVGWAESHAALPAVAANDASGFDMYFSARDARNRARVARARVEIRGGTASAEVEPQPLLGPGAAGAFDESGVTVSCVVEDAGSLYLFYTGWTLGVTVPFYLYAGLAVSTDGGRRFERLSPSPLLERDEHDPFLAASPFVLVEGGLWRMWYVSGEGWDERPDGVRHRYLIKYAESRDGVHWTRHGHVCVPLLAPDEYAISRPWVVRDGGRYRMWFSSRGSAYRLGYAESSDGLTWTRVPGADDLDVSDEGWDSEMIAYPCVFDRGSDRWMLYNGNGYGRSGIGFATSPLPG